MTTRFGPRQTFTALACAALAFAAGAAPTWAYFPREPIALPLYSFDAESPSVEDPQPPFLLFADAVLERGQVSNPRPTVLFLGEGLGLGRPGDDLDSFSFNRAEEATTTQWVFLFSVSRSATGDVPPEPGLVAANVVHNVADQALRGHAAGDGFISLTDFDTNGPTLTLRSGTTGNTLAMNNYDEGGQGLQGTPPTKAASYAGVVAEDNVDAMAYEQESGSPSRGSTTLAGVYFSVTAGSTSLVSGFLPGNSGADIFYDPAPDVTGLQQNFPFASAQQLGLDVADEIDALIVADGNTNGVFDAGDRVWFSLTPNSPSVSLFPDIDRNPGAAVFRVTIGPLGDPVLVLFAPGDQFGLMGQQDDIDGLELVPCGNPDAPCQPVMFGLLSGLRLIPGDGNNDGIIGAADVPDFIGCLSGPAQGIDFVLPEPLCRDIFDLNADEDIDLHDFQRFTQIYGSGPPP